ncbi:vacuole non-autophagic-related protein [Lentinula edodes]|uniref:Vacuole non-autophagic-related protein n=1 Tax=Lentinula edodes TaxID=5353 RepID=A0A1Q3DYW3_LENED|nr:vacuole non-autophagic-related protein [Lentinula edodes]
MAAPSITPRPPKKHLDTDRTDSLIRRSWHAMSERLSPFSPAALASLPKLSRPSRYTRADAIPIAEEDHDGQRPTVRDYHSISHLPPQVRVPKKIKTPVRVEGKVWFANERTWVSWLNLAVLLGTLSLALFNASKDTVARNFAYTYAVISIIVMIYGYGLYQHRITMIRRRDPGHFDAMAGPVLVSILLFFAILANFIIRVRELQEKHIPIPGADFIASFRNTQISMPNVTPSSLQ